MKSYHKLYYYKPEHMGEHIHAFDKLDGQSMRFEASFKQGFYKFGSRTQMVSAKDEQFGDAVKLFMENYSENLMYVFGRKYNQNRHANFTVFAEYCGPNSFAGRHVAGDPMDLVIFDVWIYQKGWVTPTKFIDNFGHLNIPKVVYEGEMDDEFISNVQNNKYGLKEGVIAKGIQDKDVFMCKVKTKNWLNKVKNKFGDRFLMDDIDGDKRILNNYEMSYEKAK